MLMNECQGVLRDFILVGTGHECPINRRRFKIIQGFDWKYIIKMVSFFRLVWRKSKIQATLFLVDHLDECYIFLTKTRWLPLKF